MGIPSAISRRQAILTGVSGTAGALLASTSSLAEEGVATKVALKGNVHHSVSAWCFSPMPLEELCRNAAAIGIESVELLGPKDWETVSKFGLTCAMPHGPGNIADGFNRIDNHAKLIAGSEEMLPLIKKAGLPNMIVMSGNRAGISDEEGLSNCVIGVKKIMPLAEKLGITVCMELLNSKVDHKDYQCDRTPWGVELVKQVGSERFKLLYDIYHMQIMEGDVVHTIKDNIQYIGHFHTGGVPGRAEIDETQELNYRFIIQAIVDAGYKGFIGQEFIPKRDPMTSLRQAIQICDV
jgi:hydroxypyruvate isomerase